jgi:hypothetical protein
MTAWCGMAADGLPQVKKRQKQQQQQQQQQ